MKEYLVTPHPGEGGGGGGVGVLILFSPSPCFEVASLMILVDLL
jgi:hypothetical protein